MLCFEWESGITPALFTEYLMTWHSIPYKHVPMPNPTPPHLIPSGVDFINIFMRSFYVLTPKKHKNSVKSSDLLRYLGCTHAKSARKRLMKLTPGLNFISILHTALARKDPKSIKRQSSHLSFCAFGIYAHKLHIKMLVKLTWGVSFGIIPNESLTNYCLKVAMIYKWSNIVTKSCELIHFFENNKVK